MGRLLDGEQNCGEERVTAWEGDGMEEADERVREWVMGRRKEGMRWELDVTYIADVAGEDLASQLEIAFLLGGKDALLLV